MKEGVKLVVHIARVDVESALIRPKRQGLFAIESTMPSWTAHNMKDRPVADDVCPSIHWIVASRVNEICPHLQRLSCYGLTYSMCGLHVESLVFF